MDAREEMKRWIATVVQGASEEDSKLVKSDTPSSEKSTEGFSDNYEK
jgi:hypothetical protein